MTFLIILGSLGIFLYGMKVLSEGIQKTAGEKMRQVMATMTHNRVAGVGTGFLTTCLLQSSSATTVIVVSFCNAGLLTLVESIGVIMGANLGTTLTAWIIAVVGKFSLANVALPIIGIGTPFIFIGKGKWKNIGQILIGFGLLFYGLGALKDAVPDVKSMLASTEPEIVQKAESWRAFIENISGKGYLSLVMFLVGGVLLTIAVQSSSAAMAITVTLALNGWIGFEESCAIVLGENIGTTVTAYLASLGANTNAKRAARAHFTFNILGVAWMLAAFYAFIPMVESIGSSLPDSFRTEKHSTPIGFNLAIFHSTFNFINICLLIGFVPWIAKFVTKWVKDDEKESDSRLHFITQNLMKVGEMNLPEVQNAVEGMADITLEMYDDFEKMFSDNRTIDLTPAVEKSKGLENATDQCMADITQYLVRLSASELSQRNADDVSSMIRIVSELEEASDCVHRLVMLTDRRNRKGHNPFSDDTTLALKRFTRIVGEFLDFTRKNITPPISLNILKEAEEFESSVDDMRRSLNKASLSRMQEDGDLKREMLQIDINNQLEKIGNHCLNVIQSATGTVD
ncbi:MAG: Na/Pi cotransporter family protein [Verrucomicrobiota bacterium]|nr:Na/Pi cotransporter family protein [Verrucomicrobiales bacterium]MED5471883.1 Na/Pi cotransporter family protein [Verrucomicrobiota bacterium]MEE2967856.1 Na/Pi cotransporter family protein [Verrucomicrobiota bacterium]|tara:strand:+ start:562 stop:2271 length:1710 start_codon:yes stop_codon:yes gene_type:complete